MQVALGRDAQIKRPVFPQQFQHVIEESNAGGNAAVACAIQIQFHLDFGFLRLSLYFCCSTHRILSFNARRNSKFSCGSPTLTRRQPSRPEEEETSRIKIPRSRSSEKTRPGSLTRNRRKLA